MLFAFFVLMCIIGSLFVLPVVIMTIFLFVKRNSVLHASFGEDFRTILNRMMGDMHERSYHSKGFTPQNDSLSKEEALEILDLPNSATREDIVAAYHKLMKSSHPDKGGSPYFARKLNQARDKLLGKSK